ncbi:MAG: hypothetical protein FJ038_13620 [Chloroflexi bacterium]|nr:hypothetical protein [Chloroflexota bacterium]
MGAAVLADVMDGLAAAVLATGLVREAHGYPPGAVAVPACLVDLPTELELGTTFGRGSDTLHLPVLLLAAQTLTRAGRDALSAFLVGASDVYAAIEGPHAWGTAHVARASTTTVEYAGITYLALKLDVEVAT